MKIYCPACGYAFMSPRKIQAIKNLQSNDLLTSRREVAEFLDVDLSTVSRYVENGTLPEPFLKMRIGKNIKRVYLKSQLRESGVLELIQKRREQGY